MEYFRTDVKVGGFILLALVLLVLAAIMVGDIGSWFAKKQQYTVLFRDAGLVPEGAQVSYAGYPVGQVTAIEDSYTVVASSIGAIACQKSPDASVGNEVSLCIRPEFIKVVEGDASEHRNIFRGRVDSLLFIGDAYEGEIIIGETLLITRIEPTTAVKRGDEIALYLDPDHCFVLLK